MNPENETHKTVKNSCHASEDFYKDFSSGKKSSSAARNSPDDVKEELVISLVQSDIANGDIPANIAHFGQIIASGTADLWMLPETFATGFASTAPSLAQKDGGQVLQWMKDTAAAHSTAICGTVITEDNGRRFNRFYMVDSAGKVQHYDKRHLFSYGNEQKHISQGTERPVWTLFGWKIMPLVCYDLRFPVWSRNDSEYELMIVTANWPESRITAWDVLLRARAIENMAYVAGVNRVGDDILGSVHTGHSLAYSPLGKIIGESENGTECVVQVKMSYSRVHNIRDKYGFLADKDRFEISM